MKRKKSLAGRGQRSVAVVEPSKYVSAEAVAKAFEVTVPTIYGWCKELSLEDFPRVDQRRPGAKFAKWAFVREGINRMLLARGLEPLPADAD